MTPALMENETNENNYGVFNNGCPSNTNETRPGYCPQFWDRITCWPETKANFMMEQPCPENIEGLAYRFCPSNGSWEGLKTDYSSCIHNIPNRTELPDPVEEPLDEEYIWMAVFIRDITFTLSIISLVLLLITIFIFQYFRYNLSRGIPFEQSLHCSRISIHKHLVVSFILRSIVNIINVEPYISNRQTSYRDIEALCKTVEALTQYTVLANTFWMFVEGFFLHHSLVLGVFSTEPPYKLFCFIGWGLPACFVLAWAITLHIVHHEACWANSSATLYHYIIIIPFTLALAINLVFLVNIIRVLVSKLRANNRVESNNMRKAIKATIILMPLLGLTNFVFFMNPSENKSLQIAYRVTNAVLSSSQGIFVAVLYCFMNGEVQRVLKQKWYRFKIRQVLHTSGRRRSSRTSSFFLTSGTECQNTAAEQLRLLQANKALQNETTNIRADKTDGNHTLENGTSHLETKRNNNNGEVQFMLPDKNEAETVTCLLERETVI